MKNIWTLFLLFATCLLFAFSIDIAYAESKLEPVLTYMPGPRFSVVSWFSEGFMPTKVDDKECYINESGAIAISHEKLKFLVETEIGKELGKSKIGLGEFINGTALISEAIPMNGYYKLKPLFYIDYRGNIVSKIETPDDFNWETRKSPYKNYPRIYIKSYSTDFRKPYQTYYNSVNSHAMKLDKAYEPNYNNYEDKIAVSSFNTKKHGYIDKTGEIVIDCKYDWAFPFIDGYALTQIGGVYKFIDNNGNYISELEWKSGFMNCDRGTLRPDLLFQFDDGINPNSGVKLVKIELAEVKDGIINRPVKIFTNNQLIPFNEQPQIINDRVIVPVKGICDALNLHYLINDGTLTINFGNRNLTHIITEESFAINGTTGSYGVESYLYDNNLFIPIRAINDLLEADISWYSDSNTIILNW